MELKNITTGWFNKARKELGLLPKDQQESAVSIMEICGSCELGKGFTCDKHLKSVVVRNFYYNNQPRKVGDEVNGCGCPLEVKPLSDSYCPLGYWGDRMILVDDWKEVMEQSQNNEHEANK